MADKIDNINGYDIDLPPDATPSITSLTASSTVTSTAGSSSGLGKVELSTQTVDSTSIYEGVLKVTQGNNLTAKRVNTSYFANRVVVTPGLSASNTFKFPAVISQSAITKTLATTNDIKHVYKHTVTFKFLTNTFTGKYYSTSTTGISTVAELKSKLKGTYCSPYDSSTGYSGLVVYENQHNDSYVYGILFTERSDGSMGYYWTSDSVVSITSDSWEEV